MYVNLEHISKRFDGFQAVREVSFGIRRGRLAALLGPSGSGKTTILRMIAGLEDPDSGDIRIDGLRVNDIEPSRRGIGFVFQNYALFRYMTVFDNIAFGLTIKKEKPGRIRERVGELLQLIGMSGLEKRYPAQLSGGQKQRVAFARALAPNPRLLLLDEPFAAIDAKVRRELRAWLREMIRSLGLTSIFVTHDQDEAIEVADEIIVTNQGRVEQMGSSLELYQSPATPFVVEFIGASTPVPEISALKGFDGTPPGAGGAVRPEFVSVYAPDEQVQYAHTEEAIVRSIAFRGDSLELGLTLKGLPLTAAYSLARAPLAVGDAVRLLIRHLYLFDGGQVRLLQNSAYGNGPSENFYSI
ncbi:MAG: sulfate ABC transporter ATP-binding protein [Deltaproteobacteria bacterium]|jgi:sulfate transport system ATP-binding protein|nr:sulfate ABC transporter ATP-binding protein [Deltaproteobacteria bacterium]